MFGQNAGRFRTTDFFGIVLPGFFLLLQTALLLGAFYCAPHKVPAVMDVAGKLWAPALVLILFISYILGSVFRTWSIGDTDGLCGKLFRGRLDEPGFPYPDRLRTAKNIVWLSLSKQERDHVLAMGSKEANAEEVLRDYLPPYGLTRITQDQESATWWIPGSSHVKDTQPWTNAPQSAWLMGERIYNYWKAQLCVGAPSGFEFAEASEARTRFFFGMLWAARWSLRLMVTTSALLLILYGQSIWRWLAVVAVGGLLVLLEWSHPLRETPRLKRWCKGDEKDERKNKRRDHEQKCVFWLSTGMEVILTPIFFCWSREWCVAPVTRAGLALVISLVTASMLLFVFLASKIRTVRAREVRAVYLNYVALVLAAQKTKAGEAA